MLKSEPAVVAAPDAAEPELEALAVPAVETETTAP